MGTTLIETRGAKLAGTAKLAALVAASFANGETLPATIAKADTKSGAKTIHLVSPLYWAEVAKALGPIEPTAAAVKAARKAGNRREIVALRSGLSVAAVAKLETARGARPVYTGRGTRKHLAS